MKKSNIYYFVFSIICGSSIAIAVVSIFSGTPELAKFSLIIFACIPFVILGIHEENKEEKRHE